MNNIRLYAHCVDDPRPSIRTSISVTHRWTESTVLKSHRITLSRPSQYQIVANAEPINESIEIAVASRKDD